MLVVIKYVSWGYNFLLSSRPVNTTAYKTSTLATGPHRLPASHSKWGHFPLTFPYKAYGIILVNYLMAQTEILKIGLSNRTIKLTTFHSLLSQCTHPFIWFIPLPKHFQNLSLLCSLRLIALFSPNLLRYNQYVTLYKFKVYNKMIWYIYIL